MSLKKSILVQLSRSQLQSLCSEFELSADRRSPEAMRQALSSSITAKPEQLIIHLELQQLKELITEYQLSKAGSKETLIERLLSAAGGNSESTPTVLAADEGVPAYLLNRSDPPAARALDVTDLAGQYVHNDQAVQRPDAGVQDQFLQRRPPKTYRYDSSLDPAMSWDENPERDLGEWLLGLIERVSIEGDHVVFAEAQMWKGGSYRVTSVSDAVSFLKQISEPFLNWAGKAERSEIKIPTSPLFVHERHSTKAILDGIRHRKAKGQSFDLFGDSEMDIRENLEAYEHKGPWQNRMILGDSLSVMNSLLEFEGMGGQVQMIYIDPPYGVKFGSNFQPFVRKRDVKHGGDEDMTREPEMVKAYRDTWELGLHSYLAYLRDRLMVAKELLNHSGSIFVQISDENIHHVRELLDEIFGANNFFSQITLKKLSPLGTSGMANVSDYVVWYARDISKVKFRPLFDRKEKGSESRYDWVELPDGIRRKLTPDELTRIETLPSDWRLFCPQGMLSSGFTPTCTFSFELNGNLIPAQRRSWRTNQAGIRALIEKGRLIQMGQLPYLVAYYDDNPLMTMTNIWTDGGSASTSYEKLYVVQTSTRQIQKCLLMTTDPGDLVIDPTCGSGTTAYVAEQWGRRWITIDTSRVPLALARQRLLTATFPYYELKSPHTGPAGGFVYKSKQNRKGEEIGGLVPHITLKSIANDEQPVMEVLVDRPEEMRGVTRVAGPFVVEATIAPVQPIEATLDDGAPNTSDAGTHIRRMIEVLRQSKTLRLAGNRNLTLSGIRSTNGCEYVHAEATETEKRVAIVFGPQDGAVSSSLVFEAGREAYYLKYDFLYFFGFAIEPNARSLIEDTGKLRIAASYVAVTPDVAMSDLLKTTRGSEIFSVTGLPDFEVRKASKKGPEDQILYEVELRGLDIFDPQSLDTESISGDNVPCWMLDTDYDGMCFYATQVFFPKTSAWDNLQRSLRATFDDSVWAHLSGTTSEPFTIGDRKRVAVKVIDERGNELMRVLDVTG